MAPQLPEMPKVSSFIEQLAKPEADVSAHIKEAIKLELPPGPMSMSLNVAKSVEAKKQGGSPEFKLPRVEEVLPKLPKLPVGLPELPKLLGQGKVETGDEVKPKEAGVPPRVEKPVIEGVKLKLA
ncbi:hypothetical protein KJ781_04525 [Patescibacteria group bacterium]|nr:hypothetical protein [Patescibacteria group bacterium]